MQFGIGGISIQVYKQVLNGFSFFIRPFIEKIMPCSKEFFSPLSWNSLSNSSKILFITEIVVFEHRLQVIKFYSFDDRGDHLNEVVESVCVNCLLLLQSSFVLIGVFVELNSFSDKFSFGNSCNLLLTL